MGVAVDLRVVELLCSRLCHDLVSPVGAVSNGVELLSELGGAPDAEALTLVGQSAQNAARRLRFFRAAYGATAASNISVGEIRELAAGMVGDRHIAVQLEPGMALPSHQTSIKLLLNMILMGAESLPRGGTIHVRVEQGARSAIAVSAEGAGAILPDGVGEALNGIPVESLTARTVQSYFTGRLAEACGTRINVSDREPSRIVLEAVLPR
ncbi:MAG: histidine phosphotransferase family protein [Alphaproteobacteria bacterium]